MPSPLDRRPRRGGALGLGVAAGIVSASVLWAGEVPESALSTSYGIPAALLDEVNLVFAFPHDLCRHDSQLFALDSPYPSVGLVAHTQRSGLMVLAETTDGWYSSPAKYQVGAAIRAGVMRFGLAGRSVWYSRDDVDSSTNLTNTFELRQLHTEDGALEAAVSAGVVTERFQLDLGFEWIHDRSKAEFSYELVDPSRSQSLWVDLGPEDNSRVGFTARVASTIRGSARWVAFGSWREPQADLLGTVRGEVVARDIHIPQELTVWSAGTMLSFETSHIDWIGIAAFWWSDVWPFRLTSGYSYANFEHRSEQRGKVTIAVRHNIWRQWDLRAGIAGQYREDSRGYITERESERTTNADATKYLTQSFSWGTSYRWRRLSFDATLDRQLNLTNLVWYLDVHLSL